MLFKRNIAVNLREDQITHRGHPINWWCENVPKTWRHGEGASIFLGMCDGGVTGGGGLFFLILAWRN